MKSKIVQNQKKNLTIVLAGGGSGGHITPLLSLAHALKKSSPDCRVIYIGLKGDKLEKNLQKQYRAFDEVYAVPAGKFRRYHNESLMAHLVDVKTLTLNIRDFFRVLHGIAVAKKLLKRAKPDAVFSKGGFVAVPVGIAAHSQQIPIITHDSDAVPGLANRIVGRYAQLHATGMPAEFYNYPKDTIRYVGIPLSDEIKVVTPSAQKQFKKQLGLLEDSLVLLIGGAGLGSSDVNNTIIKIAPRLVNDFDKLHIIHISGDQHQTEVGERYKKALPNAQERITVLGFTSKFYRYTGAADLVITRAGATTIAELAAQRKAVILIPAAHLPGGHQLKNAQELKNAGAVAVIDSDAGADELLKVTSQLLSSSVARKKLSDKLGLLAKVDAADKLAELLIQTAEQHRVARNGTN